MRNAAAPITGGMSWPPFEATASIAAARCAGYPARFIIGIVMAPSTTTLATALPDTVPNRVEETTATLAEPPRKRPIATSARSVRNRSPPTADSARPKKTKATTMLAVTARGRPKSPFVSR